MAWRLSCSQHLRHSQPPLTPAPGHLTPSSGIHRHCIYLWHIYTDNRNKNDENKYSLNLSFIKLRDNDELDIDYILQNGEYNNYTKIMTWENLSTDKLQFEFSNIEDDWINFSGIVNIRLIDEI